MDEAISQYAAERLAEPKWRYGCLCGWPEKRFMSPFPPERIRVLVVDDEAPARQRLVDLLRKDNRVANIVEVEDGMAAVNAIQKQQPDLVFLDVQMPELDGLGVIDAVGAGEMPLTVFVTAYDQHAIRAFEANALDYLLKPFSDERYEATMARVRVRVDGRALQEFNQRVLKLVSAAPADQPLDRLVVKSGGTTRFVRVVDIDWIEAAGVYVNLHVAGKELLYRAALNDLAARLDPVRFVRMHRSAIVNIDSIVQLEPISHGEFEVVLKNGSRSRVSRTYRTQLEKRLGQTL
jgi:two-component system LytT family response regulator